MPRHFNSSIPSTESKIAAFVRKHSDSLLKMEGEKRKLLLTIREKEKLIKQELIQGIKDFILLLPASLIQDQMSELYWLSENTSNLIKQAYVQTIHHIFKPNPISIILFCCKCYAEMPHEVNEWSSIKFHQKRENRFSCDNCEKKRDEQWERRREQEKQKIEELRSMNYSDYLKTDHWKKLRYIALRRAGFRCFLCYTKSNLQVHHRTYIRRGCEDLSDLVVLCRSCHKKHHNIPEDEE